MSSPYEISPSCALTRLSPANDFKESYCGGYELSEWRCDGIADNLMDWIIDYALKSDELMSLNHTNSFVRLRQAAARVYTSAKYEKRGEVGEIAAHAICRKYFGTIPVAARVNYLSASNDPVKAFDLVHVKYLENEEVELWLGEAKFFKNRVDAIRDAISSIESHITRGFLINEKLLLGPQVSNDIPQADKIKQLLASDVSLDKLIDSAVFPILIAANSDATRGHTNVNPLYAALVNAELDDLWNRVEKSGLTTRIKIFLIYVPLGDKNKLNKAFDARLKALQVGNR